MIDKERKTFYDAGLGDTATIHFWSNDKTGAWKYNRPIKAHCSDNQDEIARFVLSATREAGRLEADCRVQDYRGVLLRSVASNGPHSKNQWQSCAN